MRPVPRSHGSGEFVRSSLGLCPDSVMIESGVLIFHPENVFLEERVYVGHRAILKGYYKNCLLYTSYRCLVPRSRFARTR